MIPTHLINLLMERTISDCSLFPMAFALIVYIGLILGLSYQDKKGAKAEETFKSKEIPVEDKKTIL